MTERLWTEAEAHVARSASTYDDYLDECAQYDLSARSRDAWRNCRFRHRNAIAPTQVAAPLEPLAPIEDASGRTSSEWERMLAFLESDEDDDSQSADDVVYRSFPEHLPVGIAFLSDLHIGAKIEYRRLYDDLVAIRDTPGLYGVVNGDILENTKPSLKSSPALYSARITSPKKQLAEAEHFLGIARDKLLVIAQGNHDAFDYRVAGIDRVERLARDFGIPYFTERGGSLRVSVGDHEYTIITKHDYTGKSRINKSNSARRLWEDYPREWNNADVVALAHIHEPDFHHTTRKGLPVIYVRSGTYKVHDDWAEGIGYLPQYGVPVVVFFPGQRKMIPFPPHLFDDAVRYLSFARGET